MCLNFSIAEASSSSSRIILSPISSWLFPFSIRKTSSRWEYGVWPMSWSKAPNFRSLPSPPSSPKCLAYSSARDMQPSEWSNLECLAVG